MKNIFLPLLFIAIVFFSACQHENVEDYGQGISVIFDEENVWHSEKYIAQINNDKLYLYAFKGMEAYQLPYIYLQIDLKEGYTMVYEKDFNIFANPNATNFIEYYQTNTMSDGVETHGDWWVKSGNVNITKLDKEQNLLSCEIIVDMFNAVERYVEESNNEYSVAKMRIIINDLPLINQDKSIALKY